MLYSLPLYGPLSFWFVFCFASLVLNTVFEFFCFCHGHLVCFFRLTGFYRNQWGDIIVPKLPSMHSGHMHWVFLDPDLFRDSIDLELSPGLWYYCVLLGTTAHNLSSKLTFPAPRTWMESTERKTQTTRALISSGLMLK